jgi:hypothetical protein
MNKLTSKTRKAFLVAGLLSGAALSSIVFSAPAKADDCGTGTLSDLISVSKTCGDKRYTFSGNPFTGFVGTDVYTLGVAAGIHTLSVQTSLGGFNVGNYGTNVFELDYTVAVTGIQKIYSFNTGITTPDGSAVASYSMLNTASIPGNLGVPATATVNLPFATGPSSVFTPPVTSASFETTLNVTTGFVTQVTSGISQQAPMSEVPGPLPLLGAGAAFGFSRRIRNRIKVAA